MPDHEGPKPDNDQSHTIDDCFLDPKADYSKPITPATRLRSRKIAGEPDSTWKVDLRKDLAEEKKKEEGRD